MCTSTKPIRILGFLSALLASATACSARQCGPDWTYEFANSLESPASAMLALDDDGAGPHATSLFCAGSFTMVAGIAANRIARWDGKTWSPLGTSAINGVNTTIAALAAFDDDGPGPHATALYAGGAFIVAGSVTARGIAKWDGSAWSTLGDGLSLNGDVFAMAVFDDDGPGPHLPALYVAGGFSVAAGSPALHIARWDGATWTALGPGLNGAVTSLAVYDPDGAGPLPESLYAAGTFTSSSATPMPGIARWDGSAWSTVGAVPGISTMTAFDEDGAGPQPPALYAGGVFASAAGVPVQNIAKFDGSQWSDVGGGADGAVNSLYVFDDGSGSTLYAGGLFTHVGTATAPRLARLSAGAWQPVSSGPGATSVSCMASFDDGAQCPPHAALFISGAFDPGPANTSKGLRKWDGAEWSPVGRGGFSGSVNVLQVYDDDGAGARPPGLYIGGNFTAIGGVSSLNRIVRWDGTTWERVGTGLPGSVTTMTTFDDDGPGPHPTYLVAAGTIASPSSLFVATWDGQTWTRIESGLFGLPGNAVSGLCTYDDGTGPALYIIGNLRTTVGDGLRIAKWVGTTWVCFGGTALDDVPYAMTTFDDDGPGPLHSRLFIGGNFVHVNGVFTGPMVTWNGSAWSTPSMFAGPVEAVTAYDGGTGPLARGVYFATSGLANGSLSGVLSWDGAAFAAVGTSDAPGMGVGGSIYKMIPFDDDGSGPDPTALYVGGNVNSIGGVSIANAAKWSGSAWSPLGTGVTNTIQAMAAYPPVNGKPPSLYFGGNMTLAGGRTSLGLARWRKPSQPCYANCDGSTAPPVLNANDFQCFLNAFAAGDPHANCDGSTTPPMLNANDFVCFLNAFVAGCP